MRSGYTADGKRTELKSNGLGFLPEPILFCLSIANSINGTLCSDFAYRQVAGDEGRKQTYTEQKYCLTNADGKHSQQDTGAALNQQIDGKTDQDGAQEGQNEVYHRNDEAFRKEDAEYVVAPGTDSPKNTNLFFLIGNAGCDKVGEQQRCEQNEHQADPEENFL